jgi:tetratricopeptide (TPR) repeat protein
MRPISPALFVLLAVFSTAGPTAAQENSAAARGGNSAVTALLEAAEQALNAGQADQASLLLERALRIEPRNPAVWHYLGLARLAQGDHAQAQAMAAKSRSLSPAGDEPSVVASLNPFGTVIERASTYIDTWQRREQPVGRSPERRQAEDRYAEQVRRQRAARQGRTESRSMPDSDVRQQRRSGASTKVRIEI